MDLQTKVNALIHRDIPDNCSQKETERLCWFYRVWWEEQKRHIDCLVDLNISTIPELNEGFWLILSEYGLVLKQAGKIDTGDVLGIAKHWSVEIELVRDEF